LVEKAGSEGSGADVFFVDTINQEVEIYSKLGIGGAPTSGIELDVTGDADFSGTVSSIGDFDVNATKFTVASATGNTVVAGTLGVTGNVDVSAGVDVTGGNITLDTNDIVVNTDKFTVDGATGNTTAGGTLAVTGNVDASSGLDVTGANLTLDTNDILVNTNKFIVDGATGNVTSAGAVTSLHSIGLVPEYDNAALIADGADNFGTLTLEYDSSNYHNYYEWTTNEPSAQDYDIVIRYRLPEGFSSFDATAPIKLFNKVSDATGNTDVTVTMLDTANASVTLGTGADLNNTSWTESTITITGSPTFTAGGYVTITIKLTADQGDTIDVGELTLKGNW
jgi:hypothetical protein